MGIVPHLKSIPADGRIEKCQPALIPGEGNLHLLLFRKPSQKRKETPLIFPRHPSGPCLHPVSKPRAHLGVQCSCVLSQVHWLCFKTPNFRDPVEFRPIIHLGQGFVAVCPRRVTTGPSRGLKFMAKHNKKLTCMLAALSSCLCSYADAQGSSMVLASSFAP